MQRLLPTLLIIPLVDFAVIEVVPWHARLKAARVDG